MRVEATKCHEKMMEEELVGHGRAEKSTREASGMTGDKTNPVPQSGTGQYSAGSSPPGGKQLKAGERGIFFSKKPSLGTRHFRLFTASLQQSLSSGYGASHRWGGGRRAQSRNPTLPYPRMPMNPIRMQLMNIIIIFTIIIILPLHGKAGPSSKKRPCLCTAACLPLHGRLPPTCRALQAGWTLCD